MKIEELKKRYKDEWVLVEVLAEDELREPVEVELIETIVPDLDKIAAVSNFGQEVFEKAILNISLSTQNEECRDHALT